MSFVFPPVAVTYTTEIAGSPPVVTATAIDGTGAVIVGTQYEPSDNLTATQAGADVQLIFNNGQGPGTWTRVYRDGAYIGHSDEEGIDYLDVAPGTGTFAYKTQTAPNYDPSVERSAYSSTVSVTMLAAPVWSVTPTSGPALLALSFSGALVSGAVDYGFQRSSSPSFTAPDSDTKTTPTFTANQNTGTKYYRLRANGAGGAYGPWSNTLTVVAS